MRFAATLDRWPHHLRRPLGLLFPKGALPEPFARTGAIFVHIPKAAGSSVSEALFGCQVGHVAISELYAANYPAARRCFKFTIVREPLDRLHSAFQFLQRGGINDNDRMFAEAHLRGLDFAAFVERLEREVALREWWHFRTQRSFLCKTAKSNRIAVDFVGRFESLETDFAAICQRMGVKAALPATNRTIGRTSVAEVDPSTAASVRRIYACDYELLGYA